MAEDAARDKEIYEGWRGSGRLWEDMGREWGMTEKEVAKACQRHIAA